MKRAETADEDETISNRNRGMPPAFTLVQSPLFYLYAFVKGIFRPDSKPHLDFKRIVPRPMKAEKGLL